MRTTSTLTSLNLAFEDPAFRASLNGADLVFCDGFGAKIAARLTGQRLPERMTPPDWIDQLATRLAAQDSSIYLIGDEIGVAEACAEVLTREHPRLRVAGTHHGFFELHSDAERRLIETISTSGANVLLVGMGMPRQELWIDQNLDDLDASLYIPVGALFRWYAGIDRRAPAWLTRSGLEWLARFFAHPMRHFRRYAVGLALFSSRILRE